MGNITNFLLEKKRRNNKMRISTHSFWVAIMIIPSYYSHGLVLLFTQWEIMYRQFTIGMPVI